jgi:hypothetical protein
MPATVATIEGTLRQLRITHGALLAATFLYAYVVFQIPASATAPPDPVFLRSVAVMAVVAAGVAFWMRAKCLGPAFERLRMQADDAVALANWRKGVIVSDALAEGVVLFGVAIHFVGASNTQVIPFLLGGAALMLLWWPRQL